MTGLNLRSWVRGALFIVLLGYVSPTFGAPTAPAGSIEEDTDKSTWDKVGVGLFGWTYGNGLGRWDGRKPKPDGQPGDPIEITNQISITYPTSIGMDFVVVPAFVVRPFLNTTDKAAFDILNPSVGITGTVYSSGGFSWWARFDNTLPLTATSRTDGMLLSPGAVNSFAYRFANTGWEVQAVVVPSVTLYSDGDLKSFLYFSPRLNYSVNSALTLFGILEAATETKRATGLTNFVSAQATNVGAGFKYSFADLYVQPFINVYPFNRVNDTTTFIGMMFGGKLK
jgi:hypothetical protein